MGVPHPQQRLLGEAAHRGAVARGRSQDDLAASLAVNPLSRPATARLAASRLTSHSNGPGSVSSKSLRSKTSRRSGEANAPKLARCASPHSCTRSPAAGVRGQVGRHRQRRPPVERERRHQHPPVPDGHQLGHPRRRLVQQQPDRITRPARRELGMRLQRRHRPGILTPGHPVRASQLLLGSGLRRTPARCPRASPHCPSTISCHSHDPLPLRHGSVRPANPWMPSARRRADVSSWYRPGTLLHVTCPRVRGAHAHSRRWLMPGHHPGVIRGRGNLAALGHGAPRPRSPGGAVACRPKTARPSRTSRSLCPGPPGRECSALSYSGSWSPLASHWCSW